MKKHFSFIFAVAAAFAFTACEDIPAPYEINNNGGGTETDVLLSESFATSLGSFQSVTTVADYNWAVSYSCAQVTGYDSSTKENNDAESWLVSPVMDFSEVTSAHVSFDYILRYALASTVAANHQLLVSSDYQGKGKVGEATWEPLDFNLVQGSDWDTWYSSGNVNIPQKYMGGNVTVALRYKSTTAKASTWEVKNFLVVEGEGDYDPNGGGEDEGVKTLPYSETFETTLGGFKSETTSGSGEWIIDFKTAKATGYDNASKLTTAGSYYLVSPEISLSGVSEAYVSYEYILRYNKSDDNQQLFISTDYTDGASTATWTPLCRKHTEGVDWTTFEKCQIDIPAEYMGKTIRLAFYYNTNNVSGSTWEVKNFSVQQGKATAGGDKPGEDEGVKTLPYEEAFTSSMGAFVNQTTSGSGAWVIDFKTAKATGYDNASQVTTAGSYYLVSPEISLAGISEAYVSYEYILRYNRADDNQQLLISADYTDAASTATWTPLCQKHTEGVDWTTFEKKQINIPAEYMGKTIRLAFYYNTNNVSGSTWEVKNFSIKSGKAGDNNDDEPSTEIGGLEDFANGDFETWSNNAPLNWKTASTAGNASLSQSTDAHSGSYSVKVGGSASANKRLGYKEMKLTPGTYTVKFYAKAATNAGGSVRPGYVPIKDGTVGAYVYGEYTNGLTENDWTLVTHQFEIKEESVCCLVIMNSKNPGADILIDDFSISKQ